MRAAVRAADFDAAFLDTFRIASDASNRLNDTRDLLEQIDELTEELMERRREESEKVSP